jgi:hypothetical protein
MKCYTGPRTWTGCLDVKLGFSHYGKYIEGVSEQGPEVNIWT